MDEDLAISRWLWQLSALRLIAKSIYLAHTLAKAGFNPKQPREPAGSPTGGQWVAVDGAQERVHLAVSAFDNPGLYYVDLQEEDRKGGHAFSKHVGKSAGYLKSYVVTWNMDPTKGSHPAEGSFHTLGEANNLVSAALRAHPDIVEAAIAGGTNLPITHRFGYSTGYEAYQPDVKIPPIIRTTYWVEIYITHDARPYGKGYRVVTAYPMNDIPDEVPRTKYIRWEF